METIDYVVEKKSLIDLNEFKFLIESVLAQGEICPKCGSAMSQGRCTACGFGC